MDLEGSEGCSAVNAGGRIDDPFKDYVLREGFFRCAGYLLRTPTGGGHWVALIPQQQAARAVDEEELGDCKALLCDSLFPSPFRMCHEDIQQLLLACAMEISTADAMGRQTRWACFLVAPDP